MRTPPGELRAKAQRVLAGQQSGTYNKAAMAHDLIEVLDALDGAEWSWRGHSLALEHELELAAGDGGWVGKPDLRAAIAGLDECRRVLELSEANAKAWFERNHGGAPT